MPELYQSSMNPSYNFGQYKGRGQPLNKTEIQMKKIIFISYCILCTISYSLSQANQVQPKDPGIPPAIEIGVTKAINQAKQEKDKVLLSNPNFHSEFDRTSVSLRPRGNELDWTWQLQRINGQITPPVTPRLSEKSDKEFVDYYRGNIIERYIFHRGNIEQQFIIKERPPSGDLVIEGAIFSKGQFSEKEDHWLWSNEKSSVKLGQLYVFDANGVEIEANYVVACDYATISIAEKDLAQVQYPVTIDPEIGPDDFRISVTGPEGNGNFDALTPAIAYNSTDNNYLVVWTGEGNTGTLVVNELEIFGQIINADGSLLISDFRISAMGPNGNENFDATNPAAAYNPVANNYLVTWTGDDNSAGTINNEFEIYGQLITNLGAETGPNDFRISNMGPDGNENFDAENSAIAYNSTTNNFLVVWDGDDAVNGEKEIYGQLIAADGTEIGSDFQISEQGPATNTAFGAQNPSLAYNNQENNYLVVWQGDDNSNGLANDEFEIYGQRVTAGGATVGSVFKISDMGPDGNENFDATEASIAYNSTENEYLVVWQGDDNNESVNNAFEIYGQRISAGGLEIGENDFRITAVGPTNNNANFLAERPDITYDKIHNRYLVVWEAIDRVESDNEDETWGQFIDAAGFQMAPDDFRISQMGTTGNTGFDVDHAAVAFNSIEGNYLAVWAGEDVGLSTAFEIYGQLLDLEAPSNQFRISTQGPENDATFDAGTPAVAYNTQDSNYLVVWTGEATVSGEEEIFGQLVSKDGFLLDFAFQISETGPAGNNSFDAFAPEVAYNSQENNFLVVWHADATGVDNEFEIFGQFISADGKEIGPDDFPISDMGPDDNADFDALLPSIAYNSMANNFLVVWYGDDDLNSVNAAFEIYGQIINTLGDRTFENDIRISDMGSNDLDVAFNAFNPDVAYNSKENNYLVVWYGEEDTGILVNDEFEIYGQLIAADGTETGTNDFRISQQGPDGNPNFDAEKPSLAYNDADNNYLVVWYGDFNNGTFLPDEEEIFGQLIAANGGEINGDFRISDMGTDGIQPIDAREPSIQYDAINQVYLVVWHGNDNEDEFEIYGQFLSNAGAEIAENDFQISEMGFPDDSVFNAFRPALAYNPLDRNFLVVWEGDDDILTQNNAFEIIGELVGFGEGNGPCPQQLTDVEILSPIASGLFQASEIISSSGQIENGSEVIFDAGGEINLLGGFEVELSGVFEIQIGGCDP